MRSVIYFIGYLFTPHFWRWTLLGRVKVRVYLDSGEHIDFLCQKFEWKSNSKDCSWSADGLPRAIQIDPKRIVAMKEL